ncbi:MAG: hypothetical protein K9N35_00085 [Candidatus Marinimicrobia bacterium]|nr:hypothetical protein [Candidatus Neomarinimicrobiota bacterium]
MKQSLIIKLVILCILGLTFTYGQLSPGPLSEPHTHLSGISNCLNCHTWGNNDFTQKCLDCHKPIQNRIKNKTGFHGQMEDADCVNCHTDHVKSDFKMIQWDPSLKAFDHDQIGYKLAGKHRDLECRDCHKRELIINEDVLQYAQTTKTRDVLSTSFLGLGNSCADCHADVHRGEFIDQKCQECHSEKAWLDIRGTFDHDKKTDFPIKGAHKKIKCEQCHKEKQATVGKFQVQRFTGLEFKLCTNCHEDKHKSAFGENCLRCHSEDSFKSAGRSTSFDHEKSRFPLVGKHIPVKCEACHTRKNQFSQPNSFDQCTDCHEDYHQGAFVRTDRDAACENCHTIDGFFPARYGIAEHQKTRFPLVGAHLAQPCIKCHLSDKKSVYHWDSLKCETCHDNVHGAQFARYSRTDQGCASCHKSTAWSDLLFDHQKSNFPLVGRHAELDCAYCHKPAAGIVQYEATAAQCSNCHQSTHGEQFTSRQCSSCHGATTWKINNFNHENTQFALDGQHKKLSCGQCHKYEASINTIRFQPIAHKCQDCHGFGDFK